MKKKIIIIALISLSAVLFIACKNNTTVDESALSEEIQLEETADSTEEIKAEVEETVSDPLEISLELLEDSSWCGVDSNGVMYSLELKEGVASFEIKDDEGIVKAEGSYAVDVDGLSLLVEKNKEDVEKYLSDNEIEIVMNGEESYLKMGNVYLAKDSLENAKERFDNLDAASIAVKYLNGSHCWFAAVNDEAVVLFFDGNLLEIKRISYDGQNFEENAVDASWGINTAKMIVCEQDANDIEDMTWDFQNEEEYKVLTIDDGETEMVFYELSCESIDNGVEMAESYLQNKDKASEASDMEAIKQLLNGYEGVSIVDAFVMAGLNPTLKNRSTYAELFEIENYRGTAKQNLFLLESMGGKIK